MTSTTLPLRALQRATGNLEHARRETAKLIGQPTEPLAVVQAAGALADQAAQSLDAIERVLCALPPERTVPYFLRNHVRQTGISAFAEKTDTSCRAASGTTLLIPAPVDPDAVVADLLAAKDWITSNDGRVLAAMIRP